MLRMILLISCCIAGGAIEIKSPKPSSYKVRDLLDLLNKYEGCIEPIESNSIVTTENLRPVEELIREISEEKCLLVRFFIKETKLSGCIKIMKNKGVLGVANDGTGLLTEFELVPVFILGEVKYLFIDQIISEPLKGPGTVKRKVTFETCIFEVLARIDFVGSEIDQIEGWYVHDPWDFINKREEGFLVTKLTDLGSYERQNYFALRVELSINDGDQYRFVFFRLPESKDCLHVFDPDHRDIPFVDEYVPVWSKTTKKCQYIQNTGVQAKRGGPRIHRSSRKRR